MIKFFRKIRQNLLMENKTGKYLKYAIGEIVLVVFGILIALQINNWNENQKLKVIEKETLKALENDILESFNDIEHDAKLNQLSLKSALQINEYINNNLVLTDTIITAFEIASYDYKLNDVKGAYKSLQNKGVELISNKDLRTDIVAYYEIVVPFLQRTELNGKLFYNLLFPYYQKHFRINQEDINRHDFSPYLNSKYQHVKMGFVPLNESQLKSDPEFKVILRDVIYNRSQVLNMYINSKESVQTLLDNLKREINK
jgi:hypothetical protein